MWVRALDTTITMLNIFAEFIEKINGNARRFRSLFCTCSPDLRGYRQVDSTGLSPGEPGRLIKGYENRGDK